MPNGNTAFHIFNCDKCNYTKVFTHFKVSQVKTIHRIHKKICKKTGRTEMPQRAADLMEKSDKQMEGRVRFSNEMSHKEGDRVITIER